MRRHLTLLAAVALIAAPAAAQRVGERTTSPEQLLSEIGAGLSDAAIEQAAAAANAHPLGTVENPVRVGGPEGERAYIGRLRCGDGSAPAIGARSSGGTGAFGSIVDTYALDCGAAAPGRVSLVMDMYHAEHREDRAPPGFTLRP